MTKPMVVVVIPCQGFEVWTWITTPLATSPVCLVDRFFFPESRRAPHIYLLGYPQHLDKPIPESPMICSQKRVGLYPSVSHIYSRF